MPSTATSSLPGLVGQTVTVHGWVTTTRSSGKIAFLVLRDGSGYLQCVVVKNEVGPEVWDRFATLTQETSLRVRSFPGCAGRH